MSVWKRADGEEARQQLDSHTKYLSQILSYLQNDSSLLGPLLDS